MSAGRPAVAILISVVLLLTGCATMINSERQSVLIITYPPEAEVWVDDRLHVRSPGKVSIGRQSDHVVVVEKEGYEPAVVKIIRARSEWTWLNVLCMVFVVQCWKSDLKDGGYYTFEDEIVVKLQRKNEPVAK